MGLLGRLAKIGSGMIRQALSPDETPTDEELDLHPSPAQPVTTSNDSEALATQADQNAIEAPAEMTEAPGNDSDSESRDDGSVQTTKRDGNRRSL